MAEEQVLVTANKPTIHYSNGDYFHIQPNSEAWVEEVLDTANFVDRWMAEQDATILQLIPYIVLFSPEHKVFSYQRKSGGEKRLDAKYSVGIGGHINLPDKRKRPNGKKGTIGWATVEQGAIRETIEELDLEARYVRENLKFVGTIYTPKSQDGDLAKPGPTVGQVHLGIVYMLPVESAAIKVKEEDQLVNYKFLYKPTDLTKYERWSQLVLQNIDTLREELTKTHPKVTPE